MTDTSKVTFAVLFGNRQFFPSSHIACAQAELPATLHALGHATLELEHAATRYGAVETPEEGRRFARFLQANRERIDGVILSLPNFGDENGALAALQDAGVPIFIQAYPDDLEHLGPSERRDSFCGKLSIMDVFHQARVPFTVGRPHVVHPSSDSFRRNIEHFAAVCRVVRVGRRMTVGSIGARTTPFKTVRIDEIALQRHGINIETFDLSDIFARMKSVDSSDDTFREARARLATAGVWDGVPDTRADSLVALLVVLKGLVAENSLEAMSIRCWPELQYELGISPCVVNGVLSEGGLPVACEVDTGSAVMMRLLGAAGSTASTVLDWNNNYGDDEESCILFHCGNVPLSLMASKGRITEHAILRGSVGEGRSYGCNQGRLAAGPITFGGLLTEDGCIHAFLGGGHISSDEIPADYFGVAGVARIPELPDVLLHLGRSGHRHHVAVTAGSWVEPLREAMTTYLGYHVTVPQRGARE